MMTGFRQKRCRFIDPSPSSRGWVALLSPYFPIWRAFLSTVPVFGIRLAPWKVDAWQVPVLVFQGGHNDNRSASFEPLDSRLQLSTDCGTTRHYGFAREVDIEFNLYAPNQCVSRRCVKTTSYLVIPLQGDDIMQFESSRSQSDRTPHAACISVGIDSASCTQYERPTIEAVPGTYNYSHLVGDPAMRNHRLSGAVSFDELLTPEDRIFLQFGLRIAL